MGWRDSLAVKSTSCFPRGPEFNSWQLMSVTLVPEDLISSCAYNKVKLKKSDTLSPSKLILPSLNAACFHLSVSEYFLSSIHCRISL